MADASWIGQLVAWQIKDLRERFGAPVTFAGVDYFITPEAESGAKVGEQALPRDGIGPDIASSDPHVFPFSAGDFQPNTDVRPPLKHDVLLWHGKAYLVTNVDYDDVQGVTITILAHAYWRDYADPSGGA